VSRDPHKDSPILTGGAPLAEAAGVLVLLHGRGGSAQDMLALAKDIFPQEPGEGRGRFAWFVPEAAGRQWYPYSLLEKLERNRPALNSALGLVKRVLAKAEAAGVAPERTVLLGFSQGAGVALEFAVRHPHRYGGIIALSGGLLGAEGTPRDYEGSLEGTPVFLGAGDIDPHLPRRRVTETAEVLERLGAVVTRRTYAGLGHAIDPEEIGVAREMMEAVIAAS
jgi:predicted esterase